MFIKSLDIIMFVPFTKILIMSSPGVNNLMVPITLTYLLSKRVQ